MPHDERRIDGAKTEPVPSCWPLLGAKVEPQACPNELREEKGAPAKSPQEHQEGGQESPRTSSKPCRTLLFRKYRLQVGLRQRNTLARVRDPKFLYILGGSRGARAPLGLNQLLNITVSCRTSPPEIKSIRGVLGGREPPLA